MSFNSRRINHFCSLELNFNNINCKICSTSPNVCKSNKLFKEVKISKTFLVFHEMKIT